MGRMWLENLLTVLGIVLSVLVLSISVLSADVISSLENRDVIVSDINETALIELNREQINGSDVIAFIRYYQVESEVIVSVVNTYGTMDYISQNYDYDSFPIKYDDVYTVSYEYNEQKITKINCFKN
ncbi:MAG: hypothetical protein BGO41_01495 [Clostridiales bacterium 38-18]|nr:MAG: hypothetical protein BGO41_01495 [Clostridiales bacterium 38-18]